MFYRYLPIFTDIFPIFFQKFQHKRVCSTVAIFRWKNRYFPIFQRKIDNFTDFSPIFPLIGFFSAFSFQCKLKIDFSTEKTDFFVPGGKKGKLVQIKTFLFFFLDF